MAGELQGRRVAFLVANEGVEQVELTEPWKAVEEAGGTPELLAPEAAPVQAFDHLDRAGTFDPDRAVGDADPADYVALVLPGGVANAELVKVDELVDSASSISGTVDAASHLFYLAFSNPVIKAMALATGTAKAGRALRKRD